MLEAILGVLGLIVLILIFIVIRIIKDAPDRAELARLQTRDEDLTAANQQLEEKSNEIENLLKEHAALTVKLEMEQRNNTEKLQILQDSEARLKTEFENLANKIFEDKGKILTEQNRDRMSSVLQPFKEQLESFRKRVDEIHNEESRQTASLREHVRNLQEMSNKVSDEANNLALAIRGDAKKQGDWGELIIERIFEASGLKRGREYDTQTSMRGDDGNLKRLDFIVYLPGEKAIIVDSKVSLTAYDRYCGLEDENAANTALSEHLKSVRKHVGELQAKDYSDLLGNRTLDFVIMCVPLEPAYQTALQFDTDLIYDLAKTNVVITGPSTLMITLKLIAQIWRRENENRNAAIIADKAGKLYDQVALIYESITDAEKKLEGVSEAFDTAKKRLMDGRGNLVRRVEELKGLGAKVSKQLPDNIIEEADNDADIDP